MEIPKNLENDKEQLENKLKDDQVKIKELMKEVLVFQSNLQNSLTKQKELEEKIKELNKQVDFLSSQAKVMSECMKKDKDKFSKEKIELELIFNDKISYFKVKNTNKKKENIKLHKELYIKTEESEELRNKYNHLKGKMKEYKQKVNEIEENSKKNKKINETEENSKKIKNLKLEINESNHDLENVKLKYSKMKKKYKSSTLQQKMLKGELVALMNEVLYLRNQNHYEHIRL